MMSSYLARITLDQAVEGLVGKSVVLTGDRLQLAYVYLEPHAEIPWHSHPAETLVTLVQGGYDLWIGDEHFWLEPGWAAWVPSNVPHRVRVGDQLTVEVEAFAPPREEYAIRTRQYDFRRTNLKDADS